MLVGGLLQRPSWLLHTVFLALAAGQEFGVFLGQGPSTICYSGLAPPTLTSFSICASINMHQAVPNSDVFRYSHPTGVSFTIGLTYYGLFTRIVTKQRSRTSFDGGSQGARQPKGERGQQQQGEGEAEGIIMWDERFSFEVTLPPKMWRGICITYDADTREARCFIDGKEESVSSMKIMKIVADAVVESSKNKILAMDENEQTSKSSQLTSIRLKRSEDLHSRLKRQTDKPICAGSDEFEGEIAGLQIWNDALVDTDVMRKSNCKRAKLASAGNILNLNSEWRFYGNSSKKIYQRTLLCSNLDTSLLVKPAGSFPEANDFCIGVGGHLTEPAVVNEELLSIAKGVNETCIAWDDTVSWLTHTITNPKIETKFCEALDKEGKINFVTCVRRLACSLCIAPIERFTLYGHAGEYFNYVYYLYSDKLGEVRWIGVRGSSISRTNNSWVLSSTEHTITLSIEGVPLPIGRRMWSWSTKLPGKNLDILLTFTVCRTSEFSCEDGQCVSILKRCDDVVNCRDSSDEKNCNVIRKPKSYDTVYVPPTKHGETLPVALGYHVDVYNLGRITTDEGRARVDLGLTMTWYDSRIDFSNLKPVQKNYFQCDIVWLPRIRAITGHGDGSVLDINTYENFCYVYADDQDEVRALTDPYMGYVSPGIRYPIQFYLGILAELPCEFNFVRYPFDRQLCNVSIMIMNAPGQRYFKKYTEGVVVPYLNKKLILLEYKLTNITTEVGYNMRGSDNNTYFVMTLHFRRLYGYHIMNSFFPSLLMGLVSYSTFYFQIDDFTNRIMVSLTAQLVLAALFTSTTASSVKTPYLKMIDVWYACIIAFCFLIVISQVIVDAVRNKVEADYKKKMELETTATVEDDPSKGDLKHRIKTFKEQMRVDIPLDFVDKVNTGLKAVLMGLLVIFVFVYSVVAAGFY